MNSNAKLKKMCLNLLKKAFILSKLNFCLHMGSLNLKDMEHRLAEHI